MVVKIVEGLPPRLTSKQTVAIDLEMFGLKSDQLHRPHGQLACAQFCFDGETVYVVKTPQDLERAIKRVRRGRIVFHGSGFDVPHIRRWAELPQPPVEGFWDTLYMERLLWSGYYDDFGLADLARRYLQEFLPKDTRKEFINGSALTNKMIRYAAKDAWATWHIQRLQEELCQKEPTARRVWEEIDGPAFWAIQDMNGMMLDTDAWKALDQTAWDTYYAMEEKLGFNPNSPPQTRAALAKAGLHVQSTGEKVIGPLQEDYPIVKDVLDAREQRKLAGTYGADWADRFVEDDGRVHFYYNVTGAITGRVASDSPNGQNIPHDGRYRSCFVSPRGSRIVVQDISTQEPRITAQVTGDSVLLRELELGLDLHWETAKAVFPHLIKNPNKVDKELRRQAKIIRLGLAYGMTAWGLARNAHVSEEEAERRLNAFFSHYSQTMAWMQRQRYMVRQQERITDLADRFMYANTWSRQSENHAVNFPIQATAASMLKLAAVKLHAKYPGESFPLVGMVHDEFVAEARTKDAKKVSRAMKTCIEEAFTRFCPDVTTRNLVEERIGMNWGVKG